MVFFFFFQAEDGIRDAQESRGLGDVYKRQVLATHPGTTDVHLQLVSPTRTTVLRLDDRLRVSPSPSFMGDVKVLLGAGCLPLAEACWSVVGPAARLADARRPRQIGTMGR